MPLFTFEGDQAVQQAQRRLLEIQTQDTLNQEQKDAAQKNILDAALQQEREAQEREGSYANARSYNALILNAFPALPQRTAVNESAAPEANLGYKERKRRQKEHEREYQRLNAAGRLVDYSEIQNLHMFKTKEGREKWAKTKLSHSDLTMGETVAMVSKGDYSNFENLDNVMRNMFAKEALERMIKKYRLNEAGNGETPEQLCARIQTEGGVSALLDPALRLGLSLAQKEGSGYSDELKELFRKLDEHMSTAVMLQTLTHQTDLNDLKNAAGGAGQTPNPDDPGAAEAARNMQKANQAQQIQIAKRLLLMHIGTFNQVNKDEQHQWQKPVAVALSHCSRVMLTLPMQTSETQQDRDAYRRMWNSIFYQKDRSNPAMDNKRPSSTHSIALSKRSAAETKEKKVFFNLQGQRGMNVAIGGLGNRGVSGRRILNNGSCGHFYSMYKEGDTSRCGAILMGLESDSYGVKNQLGHTHDIKATGEKASSLGGQRTDEVGLKYGGRRCDLSTLTPEKITAYMEKLEDAMKHWQELETGLGSGSAAFVMKKLVGPPMTPEMLANVLTRLDCAAEKKNLPWNESWSGGNEDGIWRGDGR